MRVPIVDIVMLSLLILFFGTQQHSRRQKYYRLWFVGWTLILASYVVADAPISKPALVHLQAVVRYDVVLAGVLFFMVSFLATREGLWGVIQKGLIIGVPAVLAFDALEFFAVPKAILVISILAWQLYGVRAAKILIPKPWGKARIAIYCLIVLFGGIELWRAEPSGGRELLGWALTEVTACSAVLYASIVGRRSVAGWVGMFGFALWGLFYALSLVLPEGSVVRQLVFQGWTLPKYFVAFSMILKTFEDAAEEKTRLAEGYRKLYEEFRMLFEGHPQPMWIAEADGSRLLSANAAAVNQYGFSLEEFLAMKPDEVFAITDPDRALIESLYPSSALRFERHRYKDGHMIWATVDTHAIEFRGEDAMLISSWDVTEQVESRRRLSHQANHDELTGLPNRTLLDDRIQQCMKRCDREDRRGTLLTIDVDHFKRINDTYGHQVGDECLKVVAARLASKIRQVDTIARVGGEEFRAIVGGLHMVEDAEKVADSLLRVFDEPVWLGELDLQLTVSIGIAIYPDDANEVETLTRRSDEALYAAKRAGRNRAVTSASLGVRQRLVEEIEAA